MGSWTVPTSYINESGPKFTLKVSSKIVAGDILHCIYYMKFSLLSANKYENAIFFIFISR